MSPLRLWATRIDVPAKLCEHPTRTLADALWTEARSWSRCDWLEKSSAVETVILSTINWRYRKWVLRPSRHRGSILCVGSHTTTTICDLDLLHKEAASRGELIVEQRKTIAFLTKMPLSRQASMNRSLTSVWLRIPNIGASIAYWGEKRSEEESPYVACLTCNWGPKETPYWPCQMALQGWQCHIRCRSLGYNSSMAGSQRLSDRWSRYR